LRTISPRKEVAAPDKKEIYLDKMANAAADWKYEFFNVSFPAEYVAHVEINRPEKLNAFVEA
jgi:hypothetical protein